MLIEDPHRDPLGAAMLAYLRGQSNATIQVYSDIAIDDVIPVRYLFRAFEEMPTWEQTALRACRGRVLDLGAGAGSHALWLQSQGHAVVAVDNSPGAVAVMKDRGLAEVWHTDFEQLNGNDRFDTVLLMMNGIGVVGNLKGLNRFLTKAKNLLRSGGQILLDSSDIRYLYEAEGVELPLPDGRYHGIIGYQMTFADVQGEAFSWLYLDFKKLAKQAEHLGWCCQCLATGPHFEYLARLTWGGEG